MTAAAALAADRGSRGTRRVYFAVFFAAGVPALIYQVVWQRVFTLYFGVDVYAAAITVSTFMLGLGLGSLFGGAVADRSPRPGHWYAGCEAVLAALGAVSIPVFETVGGALAGSSLMVVALTVMSLLLVPTFLMGMTLPLMVRTLTNQGGGELGADIAWLYGINTLGASLGALLSTYVVIGSLGFFGATGIAAGLNGLLAAVVFVMVRRWGGEVRRSRSSVLRRFERAVSEGELRSESAEQGRDERSASELSGRRILVLAFLSGAVALGFEILWYRLLQLILHGTAYVFGTILSLLLLSMGVGSVLGRRSVEKPFPARRFGIAQLIIAGLSAGGLVLLGRGSMLPGLKQLIAASFFTAFHPTPGLFDGWSLVSVYSILDVFFWPLFLFGIPGLAMGYGFPHLLRAASASREDLGRSLGKVYFSNIAGATSGSLIVGFFLIDRLGSEVTALFLSSAAVLTGVLAGAFRGASVRKHFVWAAVGFALLMLLPRRGELVRALHFADSPKVEFVGREDKTGIVALRHQEEVIAFSEERAVLGEMRLYIDGSRHGNLAPEGEDAIDREVTLVLAAHRKPRRVLSVGLGSGRMVAAALEASSVEEVVVVELSSGLREILSFTSVGRVLENSPKLRYINDDGRRWLLANRDERFDLIVATPLHAAHAFSGNLYSLEFFELVRSHLTPRGLFFTRTVDPYSTAHTLATAFPELVLLGGMSYLGSSEPFAFSASRAQMPSEDILRTLKGTRSAIVKRAAGAPLIRDFWPRSEYYLTYPWARALDPRAKHDELQTGPTDDLSALVTP